MHDGFSVRRAGQHDLAFFENNAKELGWNPGIGDIDCFYECFPQDLFVGCIGSLVIGCISAVCYDDSFGFIGYYIVLPEYRKQGFGTRMWKVAMDHLGDRIVALDGVLEQVVNYEKWGFVESYHTIRFVGVSRREKNLITKGIVPISSVDPNALLEFDSNYFPVSRGKLLQHWLANHQGKGVALMENEKVIGYGFIRKCVEGWKIGPLFAESLDAFLMVLRNLLNVCPDEQVSVDIPDFNQDVIDYLRNVAKWNASFETSRMYRIPIPCQSTHFSEWIRKLRFLTFAVTSLEIG